MGRPDRPLAKLVILVNGDTTRNSSLFFHLWKTTLRDSFVIFYVLDKHNGFHTNDRLTGYDALLGV